MEAWSRGPIASLVSGLIVGLMVGLIVGLIATLLQPVPAGAAEGMGYLCLQRFRTGDIAQAVRPKGSPDLAAAAVSLSPRLAPAGGRDGL